MKKKLFIVLVYFFQLLEVKSQCLSGEYTIGNSGADYSTVQEALNDLNQKGWTNTVYFNIQPGSYEVKAHFDLSNITPIIPCQNFQLIIFRKKANTVGDVVFYSPADIGENYILHANNFPNLRFEGIKFRRTGQDFNAQELNIVKSNNSLLSFFNCEFEAPKHNGIIVGSFSEAALITFTKTIQFDSCLFLNGAIAIHSYESNSSDLLITESRLVGQSNSGINLIGFTGVLLFEKNYFDVGNSLTSSAIKIDSSFADVRILQNHIISQGNGIEISRYTNNPVNGLSKLIIASNFIITPTGRPLLVQGETFTGFAWNSVKSKYGIVLDAAVGYKSSADLTATVAANIFDVADGPAIEMGTNFGLENTEFEANCFVPRSGDSILVHQIEDNLTYKYNDWKTSEREVYSLYKSVNFVSSTDLHLADEDKLLRARATGFINTINQIFDIDGQDFKFIPDIGADQMNLPAINAGITILGNDKQSQACGTNHQLRYVLDNRSNSVINNAVITLTINGQAYPEIQWAGNLDIAGRDTQSFLDIPFVPDTIYEVILTARYVNGVNNLIEYYNSSKVFVYTDLSGGEITVGLNGGLYPSVEALNERLKISKFCNPTRILLLPGEHFGSLGLSKRHAHSTNKPLEITSATGNANDVIWRNGVLLSDHNGGLYIHDITIKSAYSGSGRIRISNGFNIKIQRCTVDVKITQDILLTLLSDTSVQVSHCVFESRHNSTLISDSCVSVNIFDNSIMKENKGFFAFYISNSRNGNISRNKVNGGMGLENCDSIKIWRNNSLSITEPWIGINERALYVFNSTRLSISNNFFQTIRNIFYNTVDLKDCSNVSFIHNTVRCIEAERFALSVDQTVPLAPENRIVIYNNILYASDSMAIAFALTGKYNDVTSDHNCFYTPGNKIVQHYLYPTLITTLLEWQQTTAHDIHSIVFEPEFMSYYDSHLRYGASTEIGGKGVFLGNISGYDIDGDSRTPILVDIGADQFSGIETDVSLADLNLLIPNCHSLPEVLVKITNQGADTLRYARVKWTINGDTTQTEFLWEGELPTGDTTDWILLGKHYNWRFGNINVFEAVLNTASDINVLNNYYSFENFSHKMGGDYRIGTYDADFQELSDALSMLKTAGACSSIRFLLGPGPFKNIVFDKVQGLKTSESFSIETDPSSSILAQLEDVTINGVEHTDYKRIQFNRCQTSNKTLGLRFDSCIFVNNFLDGGLGDDSLQFYNCIFDNSAYFGFGGQTNGNDMSLFIIGCKFGNLNGQAGAGKVFFNRIKKLTLLNNVFGRDSEVELFRINGYINIQNNAFLSCPGLRLLNCVGTQQQPALLRNNFFHFSGKLSDANSHVFQIIFEYTKIQVEHNSFYFSPNHRFSSPSAVQLWVASDDLPNFQNNLIKSRKTIVYDGFVGFSSINNFYDLGNSKFFSNRPTLSEWQQFTGQDLNSTLGQIKYAFENNPNTATADLHLADDSPSVPLTTNFIAGITTDFDGQLRNSNQTAIGADEPLNLPLNDYVWPGDENHDSKVNTLDWLHLGVALGQNLSGPARPDQSITFLPKYAYNWQDAVQNINAKHADANGDGLLSEADTTAIAQNFGSAYFPLVTPENRAATTLQMLLPPGPYYSGQTISVPVHLGTPASSENFYGVAFDVNFSGDGIQDNSFSANFTDSWLGNDAIGFYTDKVADANYYPVAVVKTDGENAIGGGQIATLQFRLGVLSDSLKLSISGAKGILKDGTEKPLSIQNPPAVQIIVSGTEVPDPYEISVQPNPADKFLHIQVGEVAEALDIQIFDELGRSVLSATCEQHLNINTEHFSTGMYWLKIQGAKGTMARKVLIMH